MDIFSRCKYYFAKCGVFTILQNVVYLLFCKMWSIYYFAKGGVFHVLKGNIFNLFTFNPIPQSILQIWSWQRWCTILLPRDDRFLISVYSFRSHLKKTTKECAALLAGSCHVLYILVSNVFACEYVQAPEFATYMTPCAFAPAARGASFYPLFQIWIAKE